MAVRQTSYGIAMERIWPGDILVIEDGRVRRRNAGDPPNKEIKFPEGINDIAYNVEKS